MRILIEAPDNCNYFDLIRIFRKALMSHNEGIVRQQENGELPNQKLVSFDNSEDRQKLPGGGITISINANNLHNAIRTASQRETKEILNIVQQKAQKKTQKERKSPII